MKIIKILFYSMLLVTTTYFILEEFVLVQEGVFVEDVDIDAILSELEDTNTDNDDIEATSDVSYIEYTDVVPEILTTATVLGSYQNDDVIITIYKFRMYNSDVYVADVVTTSAYQILNAFAYDNFGGRNVVDTVADIAESKDAIFAVNADYASHYDTGIVIRNGVILRDSISSRDAVALYTDGTLQSFTESDTTAEELLADGVWNVWSFGPVLISDGEVIADATTGKTRNQVDNPRMAIGMVSANHYMFVAVDGRSDISEGVDVEELADIFVTLNCTEAYNLDGGGSATMWFDGEVINIPSNGEEREVGDCVYIQS